MSITHITDQTTLGATDLKISQLGIGAWAWGGNFYWGKTQPGDLRSAFEKSLEYLYSLVER